MGIGPGWYVDPSDTSKARYWDGHSWDDAVQPVAPPLTGSASSGAPARPVEPSAAAGGPRGSSKPVRVSGRLWTLPVLVGLLVVALVLGGGAALYFHTASTAASSAFRAPSGAHTAKLSPVGRENASAAVTPSSAQVPGQEPTLSAATGAKTASAADRSWVTSSLPLSDPARWDRSDLYNLNCRNNGDPSKVTVSSVHTWDLTGDGHPEAVVVANCGLISQGTWPGEVRHFDVATGTSTVLLDGQSWPQPPTQVAVTRSGGGLRIAGRIHEPGDQCAAWGCLTGRLKIDLTRTFGLGWTVSDFDRWTVGDDSEPGYAGVLLGMSASAAQAAGANPEGGPGPGSSCRSFTGPQGAQIEYSDAKHAVVAIGFDKQMKTSKGIGLGSSAASLHAAYPDAMLGDRGYWRWPLSRDASYSLGITGDKVSEIEMYRDDQDCFN